VVAKRAPRKYLKSRRMEFFARVRGGELVTDAAAGVGDPWHGDYGAGSSETGRRRSMT
jgi:hypothetical protein